MKQEHINFNICNGKPGVCSCYSEIDGKCLDNPDKYCDGCASTYKNNYC